MNPVIYPLSCWTRIYPAFANSVDPDQLASEEANWSGYSYSLQIFNAARQLSHIEAAPWSGSALFAIKYVNYYQQSGSSNLIGWKLEVGVAS